MPTPTSGQVTGHSYIVYGPLANGAHEQLIFEGVPNCPTTSQLLGGDRQALQVEDLLHPPPRRQGALMPQGDEPGSWTSRNSLTWLLGSVGEPIDPEAWL